MTPDILNKYARLLIESGVALGNGLNLKIVSEPVHWDFVNRLVKLAYESGARYVEPRLSHPLVAVHRANCAREEYLGYVPMTASSEVAGMVDEAWALLRIEGKADPDVYKDMNQERNAVIAKASTEAGKPLKNAILAREKSWCVAPFPTPKWAAQVLGGEPSDETLAAFWNILVPILRLDQDDPVAAWRKNGDMLQQRSRALDEMGLTQLRFQSPGTDLTVHLTPGAKWLGGPLVTTDGRVHFPNLPTEEVFTTPDYRKTTGMAKATRPVTVLGSQVHGAWFAFKAGEVVDYGADEGKHLLDQYFAIDPKNKFLGEIAMVDATSPIARSGHVFHTILIDENAACHFALGSGYPAALPDVEGLSEDELDERGCNKALLHIDFMIGSEETHIDGTTTTGDTVTIMDRGVFQI